MKVVPVSPRPVNATLVDHLEAALEAARSGELVSGYIVGSMSDGGVLVAASASNDVWRDLALLRRLEHRVLSNLEVEEL